MVNKERILVFRKFSFVILLFLQIFIGWKNLQYIKTEEFNASEPVAEWERRLERLKEILPLTRGVVGYISDPDVYGYPYDPNTQIAFTLTQYTMAPIIIAKSADFEWVIGILSKSAYDDWVRSHGSGFEITFLKYNVYLIHRLNK